MKAVTTTVGCARKAHSGRTTRPRTCARRRQDQCGWGYARRAGLFSKRRSRRSTLAVFPAVWQPAMFDKARLAESCR